MKEIQTNPFDTNQAVVLIPEARLKKWEENQYKIIELLEKNKAPNLLNDYVAEDEAKKELGKGTTWFWERRKAGELPFVKVGGRVFFKRSDLLKLFEMDK